MYCTYSEMGYIRPRFELFINFELFMHVCVFFMKFLNYVEPLRYKNMKFIAY